MVAGKLVATGLRPNDILLTMKEEMQMEESSTLEAIESETDPPMPSKPEPQIRLIGGATSYEGTLQVFKCFTFI